MKLRFEDPDLSSHKVAEVVIDGVADSFKFDFEKDSFRARKFIGDNAMFQVMSHKVSHGEANRLVLNNLVGIKGSVIFMDEPDMALCIRSVYSLVAQMKQFQADGNQVVVAVHNPIMIQSFASVLSLEHGRWMSNQDFIQSHTEPA
jgi:predicted ATPase